MESKYEKILLEVAEQIDNEATKEACAHAQKFGKWLARTYKQLIGLDIEKLYEEFLQTGEPW